MNSIRRILVRTTFTGLWLLTASTLRGQDLASLAIIVVDPTSAIVPEAHVVIIDSRRGSVRQAETNGAGRVDFDALIPSDYTVEIEKAGFNKYRIEKITLGVRARQEVNVQLQVAAATGTRVDVVASVDALSNDATQGVSVDHDFLENLPVNGRNVESLILMAPGMSTAAGGKSGGGFNSNGLRDNMNYYTLDGVSVNQTIGGGGPGGGGGGPGGPPGGGPGGPGGPGGGPGSGGSTALISIDSMQEMRVQTSSIAPEFGRSPGAQVVMTSRGGSNRFQGSVYYYFRNDKFDANDWFANANGFGRGAEHENRPGLTFGGPIVKNRTMFFVSIDELRLTAPYTVIADVPDVKTRASAPASLRPFLNAFPIPNGPELTTCTATTTSNSVTTCTGYTSYGAALFRGVVSNPTKTNTSSLRLDQVITSHMTAFARYSVTPSSSERRGSDAVSPNLLTNQSSHSETATAGVINSFTGGFLDGFLNDFRANYSNFTSSSQTFMDNFGGAVALTDSAVFPSGVTKANGVFNFNILGLASYSYGGTSQNKQAQLNLVDSVSKIRGVHNIKVGVDYRQTMATRHPVNYSENVSFDGLVTSSASSGSSSSYSFLSGQALNAQVTSSVGVVYPTYINLSMYGQDTWRITKWTTITYGLRWDVNPAPYARYGQQPFALSTDSIAGVTQNSPLYPTRWWNVAPRVGVAYNMSERRGHEMMLRAGFGLFYDVGYGGTAGAFNGAPFGNVRTLSQVDFPLSATELAAPPLPPVRPYGQISAADTGLTAPMVLQYNATWEKNYGVGTTLTVGLVGNNGRNLIRSETQPSSTSAYNFALLTTNGASSHYNALQLQFRKRLSSRLQMQTSYTWSHSIDTASNDFGGGGFASIFGSGQQGSSDYDIRHNFSLSGSYQLPAPKEGIWAAPLRHWFLDFSGTARTGLPFDLMGVSACTSSSTSSTSSSSSTSCTAGTTTTGLFAQVRPSVNGNPIWVSDPNVPGGLRLNAAAFVIPTGYQQGNLGRNSLRGFGAEQLNLSLRRQIPIGERVRLNIGVQAFNVFNHPNFANPSPLEGGSMASPEFGLVTRMLNSGFGGGGVNSLYQSGGPRSMELSLRFQF